MGTHVPGARVPGRDDHPLLTNLSDGDESAFWTLWQQYQRHLYAVCLRQMSGALGFFDVGADQRRDLRRQPFDPLDPLGLCAELLVKHDLIEFRQASF